MIPNAIWIKLDLDFIWVIYKLSDISKNMYVYFMEYKGKLENITGSFWFYWASVTAAQIQIVWDKIHAMMTGRRESYFSSIYEKDTHPCTRPNIWAQLKNG